jgi:hypothetical protein
MGRNNGRAIVVFGNEGDRNYFLERLKQNVVGKVQIFLCGLFSLNTRSIGIVAETIDEPEEILWKYVGE